jgi:Protein of unknown function (DUF2844)
MTLKNCVLAAPASACNTTLQKTLSPTVDSASYGQQAFDCDVHLEPDEIGDHRIARCGRDDHEQLKYFFSKRVELCRSLSGRIAEARQRRSTLESHETDEMTNETRSNTLLAFGPSGIATLAMIVSQSAIAALGGDAATVVADQAHINGKLVVSQAQKYTVHEIQAPSGTVVREFASPAGTVFGVAWSGPTMPDLRQLLGPYFDRYVEAAAQRNRRGPVLIEQSGLVVQSGGHMRAFVGKAYVPEALPQGVTVDEIH